MYFEPKPREISRELRQQMELNRLRQNKLQNTMNLRFKCLHVPVQDGSFLAVPVYKKEIELVDFRILV